MEHLSAKNEIHMKCFHLLWMTDANLFRSDFGIIIIVRNSSPKSEATYLLIMFLRSATIWNTILKIFSNKLTAFKNTLQNIGKYFLVKFSCIRKE